MATDTLLSDEEAAEFKRLVREALREVLDARADAEITAGQRYLWSGIRALDHDELRKLLAGASHEAA